MQVQLVEVRPDKQTDHAIHIVLYGVCRSLHLWPPAEQLGDDRTSGLGPGRQSKWPVNGPTAFSAGGVRG